MKGLGKSSIKAAVISAILLVSGCAVYPAHYHDEGYGPPPHAPAHGYRYKYQGHDFVYDANLGVYLIIGYADYYFRDNFYYRHRDDGWYYSRQFDRDWQSYKQDKLPPGLVKKYRDHDRDQDHDGKHERGNDHGYDSDRKYNRD